MREADFCAIDGTIARRLDKCKEFSIAGIENEVRDGALQKVLAMQFCDNDRPHTLSASMANVALYRGMDVGAVLSL